jgi:hypothetical protein
MTRTGTTISTDLAPRPLLSSRVRVHIEVLNTSPGGAASGIRTCRPVDLPERYHTGWPCAELDEVGSGLLPPVAARVAASLGTNSLRGLYTIIREFLTPGCWPDFGGRH